MDRSWIWRGKWKIIPIVLIGLWVVGGTYSCLHYLNWGLPPQAEEAGSEIFMRGCIIMVLRLNNASIPQDIAICDDGTAIRSANPPDRNNRTDTRLLVDEFQELLTIRNQWCAQPPTFRLPRRNESAYDFGIRCTDSYRVTQFRIPRDELPAILVHINHHLAPLH